MQGDILDFPPSPKPPQTQTEGQAAVAVEQRPDTIPPQSARRRLESTPPTGRRISRAERRHMQRRKIEAAAAQVFAKEGLHGASVEQILQTAGVSRSTFYRYFGNLDEVLLAVKRRASELFGDAIEQSVSEVEHVPAKIRAAITTYLDMIGQHGDFARVLHRELPGTSASNAGIRTQALQRMTSLLQKSLEDAKEAGYLLSIPNPVTVRALVFAIDGIAAEYLENNQEERALEAAPGLIDLCYRTLGA